MIHNFNNPILIVDDNADILAAYSYLLSNNGYQVICATSGELALGIIEKEPIALVLLDVMLPDISGLDVLKKIKSNPDHENIFVILISSLATSSASQSEGLETGADGYIVTPIHNREFLARIESFIRHKVTMDELRASEEKFRNVFEHSVEGKSLTSLDGKLNTNKAFCQMLGYEESELSGLHWKEITFPEDIEMNEKNLTSIISGQKESVRWEKRFIHKNGDLIWADVNISLMRDHEGNPSYYITAINDITPRKEVEENLVRNEEKYRTLFENMTQGVFYQLADGSITDVNDAALEMLGLTRNQLLGRTSYDMEWKVSNEQGETLAPELHPSMVALMTGQPCKNRLVGVFNPVDEKYRWLIVNAIPQFIAGEIIPVQVFVTLHDITERRQAEMSLKESERFLKEAQSISRLGSFKWDIPGGLWKSSKILDEIFGIDDSYERTLKGWLNLINPDWRAEMGDYVTNDVIAKHQKFDREYKIIRQNDGKESWVHGLGELEVDANNKPVTLIGTITEITARKHSEIAVEYSEKRFRALIENSADAILMTDTTGAILYESPAYSRINGRGSTKRYAKDIFKYTHPGDKPALKQILEEVKQVAGNVQSITIRNKHRDGSWLWMACTLTNLLDEPAIGAIVVNIHDITSQMIAREAVRMSEAKYRGLFESNKDGISIFYVEENNSISNFIEVNAAAYRMVGYTKEEMLNLSAADLEIDAPDDTALERGRQIREQGFATVETKIRHKNGSILHVDLLIIPILYNKRIALMNIVRDITERKRTEESITMLAHAVRSISECVSITDIQNKFIFVNSAFLKTYQYEEHELIGKHVSMVHSSGISDVLEQEIFTAALNGGWQGEILHRRKDGSEFPVLLSKSVIRYDNGNSVALIGVANDITSRKQAEEALIKSEKMYRLMADNVSDVIWTMDTDYKFTFISPSILHLRGLSQEEAMKENIETSMTPDSLQLVNKHIIRAKSMEKRGIKSKPVVIEIQQPHKNGSLVWAEIAVRTIYDQDRNRFGFIGVSRDISKRKQVEEALNDSHQQLLDIIDFLPDPTFVVDNEKKVIAWNKAMEEMTGVQKSDIIGMGDHAYTIPFFGTKQKQLMDLIDSEDEELKARYNNLYSKGLSLHAEIFAPALYDGVGAYISVVGSPLCNISGQRVGCIESIRDISDRRKSELALKESEERLSITLETTNIGIWDWDIKKDTWYASKIYYTMLGYDPNSDSPDKEFWLHKLHPDDKEMVEEKIATILNQKSHNFSYEARILNANCIYQWVMVIGHTVEYDNEGNHVRMIGIRLDINDRKLAEDEIRKLNTELEQRVKERTLQLENANKELESFSYSVSHDLRAPLRGIDGWSLALLEDYDECLDEKGRVYLQRVRSESQRMGNLIDDLLKLSRVNRFEMKKMNMNMSAVAQTIANRLLETKAGRRCEFVIQPGLFVNADLQMMEIAITNLLDNAFKYTGKIIYAKIEFGLLQKDGVPTYFVRDNGVGFDMEYATKLFGAFQRMHKQSDFPGTGIGLATVKRIISRHGGRIWVESKPGAGSTFYFTTDYYPELDSLAENISLNYKT
jgi:PAS domain S-box-containing protein